MTTVKAIKRWRAHLAASGWALVPLRLLVGFGFAAHGWAKLERGPEHFAVILATLGIPAPEVTAWATALLELVGGVLLMVGAFVVPLSVPLLAVMATAMFGVHLRYGFASVRLKSLSTTGAEFGPVGYELNLLYMAVLVTLALAPTTALSVDRWFDSRKGFFRNRESRKERQRAPVGV